MKIEMLKRTACMAGIDYTEVSFYRMRKSTASYLSSRDVNQTHIKDQHSWTRGSDVASRYTSVFGKANDGESPERMAQMTKKKSMSRLLR